MIDLFGDLNQNTIVTQQRAELYMRIYKYCAEDWVNNKDMETFVNALLVWMESVETRMTKLSAALQSHTHYVPPHVHPVPMHTHGITPHIHIAPTYGGPTTATPLTTLAGGPGSTSNSEQFPTLTPVEPTALQWEKTALPNKYINTTGAISNIAGNNNIVGTSIIGSATPHQRRVMVIPESATPNIPPYLVPTVV